MSKACGHPEGWGPEESQSHVDMVGGGVKNLDFIVDVINA